MTPSILIVLHVILLPGSTLPEGYTTERRPMLTWEQCMAERGHQETAGRIAYCERRPHPLVSQTREASR